jgi:hypothetical protein
MALDRISTSELQAELRRRESDASRLQATRDKLYKQLEEVDRELHALGVSGGRSPAARRTGRPGRKPGGRPAGGKRAKNSLSLPDAVADAMEVGAVISPREAADLVLANGYKSTAKNFNMLVSNALAKDGRFKRLGRGQYERVK